jgi:hypothetical protein
MYCWCYDGCRIVQWTLQEYQLADDWVVLLWVVDYLAYYCDLFRRLDEHYSLCAALGDDFVELRGPSN